MGLLINWLLQAIVIFVAAYVVPGVTIASFTSALVMALVLGLLNALIKPILIILTLPITILTLGLFTLVINVIILLIAASLVPGIAFASLGTAILFGLVMAVLNSLIHHLT